MYRTLYVIYQEDEWDPIEKGTGPGPKKRFSKRILLENGETRLVIEYRKEFVKGPNVFHHYYLVRSPYGKPPHYSPRAIRY